MRGCASIVVNRGSVSEGYQQENKSAEFEDAIRPFAPAARAPHGAVDQNAAIIQEAAQMAQEI